MGSPRSLRIGLTGGIGTGKTRVAGLLGTLGAAVISSDAIVHELQRPGREGLAAIVETFGGEMLDAQGELDRARLGEKVFNDPEARDRLNAIIHPLVGRETTRQLAAHDAAGAALIVLDIPLLFETRRPGSSSAYPLNLVAVVYAPRAVQLERVMTRDGLSQTEAMARIESQISIEEKRRLADVVIDNSAGWERTDKRVRELYRQWVSGALGGPPSSTP
jgi:dephospho-CoA kinase